MDFPIIHLTSMGKVIGSPLIICLLNDFLDTYKCLTHAGVGK